MILLSYMVAATLLLACTISSEHRPAVLSEMSTGLLEAVVRQRCLPVACVCFAWLNRCGRFFRRVCLFASSQSCFII